MAKARPRVCMTLLGEIFLNDDARLAIDPDAMR